MRISRLIGTIAMLFFCSMLFAQNNLPDNFPKLDENNPAEYGKSKMEWVENNSEEYKRMGGQILDDEPAKISSAEINEPEVNINCIPATTSYPPNIKSWALQSVTPIDKLGTLSSKEFASINEELQGEATQGIVFKIAPNGELFTYSDGDIKGHFQYTITNKELLLTPVKESDCGQSSRTFELVEWENDRIVFLGPDEEGRPIYFQYSFSPEN